MSIEPTVALPVMLGGGPVLVGPAAEIRGVSADAYQLPRPGAEATLVVPDVPPVVVFAP